MEKPELAVVTPTKRQDGEKGTNNGENPANGRQAGSGLNSYEHEKKRHLPQKGKNKLPNQAGTQGGHVILMERDAKTALPSETYPKVAR